MRIRIYQIVLIISAILFIMNKPVLGVATLFVGMALAMFDFIPKPRKEDEEEEQIIEPIE